MARTFTGACRTAVPLLFWACSGPVDPPSAYEDEVFLCGAEMGAERETRTDDCRRTSDCRGWVSLQGVLQEQPVTVDASLLDAELDILNTPGVGLARDAIKLYGDSPYFRLRWVLSNFPALEATPGEVE